MSDIKTVVINGKHYDIETGNLIGPAIAAAPATPAASPHHAANHASGVHQVVQKSKTLHRRSVSAKAPVSSSTKIPVISHHVSRPVPHVKRSPLVSRFAPHPIAPLDISKPVMRDVGPVAHPAVKRAHHVSIAKKHHATTSSHALLPSHIIKKQAITEALEKAPAHSHKVHKTKKRSAKSSRLSVASGALALVMLAGYFTYINMPNLSVRVAAASSGVDANYPQYQPDGYSLSGPISYQPGEVAMTFASNGSAGEYTIKQAKSNWDSKALLDNYVSSRVGDNYLAYQERGLTIYTFSGSAAWVSGGILYTVDGDAPLSNDQIRRIATSL